MRVVALLAIRNEELYLARCLEHLAENGVEVCLLDNDSSDGSLEIARRFQAHNVIAIERLPFTGVYEWARILRAKEELADRIAADWFIHHDADEIRQPPEPGLTLRQALAEVAEQGYNAVDFDEFVFIPCREEAERPPPADYVRELRRYYYFRPGNGPHRINAWRKSEATVDLVSSGGHRVAFPGLKLYPRNFILRHYIGLSGGHLANKYGNRIYSRQEIEQRGWHRRRASLPPEAIRLPGRSELKESAADGSWDRSTPRSHHLFLPPP